MSATGTESAVDSALESPLPGLDLMSGVDTTAGNVTIHDIFAKWWSTLTIDNIAMQLAIVTAAAVIGFFLSRRINAHVLAFSIRGIDSLAHKEEQTFVDRLTLRVISFVKEFLTGISFSFIAGSVVALGAYAMTAVLEYPNQSLIFCNIAKSVFYAFALLAIILQLATIMAGHLLTEGVKRAIRVSFWGLVVLQFFGVLGVVIDFMDSTRIPFGSGTVTLWTVFVGILTVLITLGVANWMADLAEKFIASSAGLSRNLQVVLARVVRIALFIVAISMGLSSVGIDLTVLSVFGGALGVGLGFGLQKIASNYISGFIILLDRSIKIGDLVEVEGFRGRVTEINTRFTVVRNNDGVECIVPNESFVTSAVQNLSYTDEPVVQYINISVAYDADVRRALDIMLEEGMRERPRIVKGRRGWAYLDSFGDSGINLRLGFWCTDPVNGTAALRTEISSAILRRFQEEGIEVPYNMLEINLRKVDASDVKIDLAKETEKVPAPAL